MDLLSHVLTACYFFAMVTTLLKAARYYVDYRRKRQWFYFLGVPGNIAFFIALTLILVNSGENPLLSGDWIITGIRGSYMGWAIFGILFEILYIATFVVINKGKRE